MKKYLNPQQAEFAKTPEEKEKLKKLKQNWNAEMKRHYPDFTKKKGFKFSQKVLTP